MTTILPMDRLKKSDEAILDLAVQLRETPRPSFSDSSFLSPELVQVTLPHRQPNKDKDGKAPDVWTRQCGQLTLIIQPGKVVDPKTRHVETLPFPSGSIPRILLLWLNSEVVKYDRGRRIELGETYNEFLRKVGFDPYTGRGKRGDAYRVKEQARQLFRSTISFDYSIPNKTSWLDMPIAPKGKLWWDVSAPDQGSFFESWISLGEDFYLLLKNNPVPLDYRIIRVFRQSPLAIDIYAWVSYRTFIAHVTGKPSYISWRQIEEQFGAGYKETKDFKKKVKSILRKIYIIRPGIGIEEVDGGMRIKPSRILLGS